MDGTIELNFSWQFVSRRGRKQGSRSPLPVFNIDATFQDDHFDSVRTGTLKVETPLLELSYNIEVEKRAGNDDAYLKPLHYVSTKQQGPSQSQMIDRSPLRTAKSVFGSTLGTYGPPRGPSGGTRRRRNDNRNII